MNITPEMRRVFEEHNGLPEGAVAYAFIMNGEVLICRIPRVYGLVCETLDMGDFTVAHGPSEEALTLMHMRLRDDILALKA